MKVRALVRPLLAAVVLVALPLAAACGGARPAASGVAMEGRATTAQQQAAAEQYRFVASHRALTEQVMCYCGCGLTLDHRSLRDCFVRDDGSYDPHGAGCGICLAEATQVAQLEARGAPAAEIVAYINELVAASGPPTRAR